MATTLKMTKEWFSFLSSHLSRSTAKMIHLQKFLINKLGIFHQIVWRLNSKISKEVNLSTNLISNWTLSLSGEEPLNVGKKSQSAHIPASLTMQTACARIVTMLRVALRWPMNATTLTGLCMPRVSARIATLVDTTNTRDMLRKLRNKRLKPRRHYWVVRSKGRESRKILITTH